MRAKWSLTIEYDPNNEPQILGNYIFVSESEYVERLGLLIDVSVAKSSGNPRRVLRVELSEDDPRLSYLIESLQQKYGYRPGPWLIIPVEKRARYYSVRKSREYSKKDLESSPFLCLHADKPIATREDGTAEHLEAEVYVAEADRLQAAKTQFGALFPFHGLCVDEPLGRQLQAAGLKGLSFEPVLILPTDKVKKPLLKLSSTFIAPRSLLPLVNESGHQIEPNTEWACYLDDGGYHPHEFKYRKEELKRFEEVDIAMSYERTGVTKARAYRWCIVSQRFRRVMAELKIPGVRYAPVRSVD